MYEIRKSDTEDSTSEKEYIVDIIKKVGNKTQIRRPDIVKWLSG